MNFFAGRISLTFGLIAIMGLPVAAAPNKSAPPKLPALELPVPDSVLTESHRLWFGVYFAGNKVGWGMEGRAPGEFEGKASITETMEMSMEMNVLGKKMKVDAVGRTHFAAEPPYRALSIEDVQRMDGQERRVLLRHKESTSYSVDTTEAGKTRTEELKNIDLRLCHVTSPEVWAADTQRKPGDTIGMVEFSADTMQVEAQTATVLREADWSGPGGKLPVWEVELFDHEMKMGVTARISRTDGSIVNAVFGQMVELRVEPEKVAKQMPDSGQPDLFLAMTISADRKLGRSADLTELVIELSAPEGSEVPAIPDTANQTAERLPNGKVVLTITPGTGKPQTASAEDRTEFLKATPRYPAGEESLNKLAQMAVQGAANDREKVEKLLRFTDSYIRDSYEIEALTVMDLLRTRKGDCSAHALLFTTLARSAGIPSREAGGWMYMGNEYKSFGGHAWNEVILDGNWVPVDPIWSEAQLDAGHIQQHTGDREGDALDGMVSGLKAKVLSFKTSQAK